MLARCDHSVKRNVRLGDVCFYLRNKLSGLGLKGKVGRGHVWVFVPGELKVGQGHVWVFVPGEMKVGQGHVWVFVPGELVGQGHI